ncbi:TLC domain-containing protein [Xylogone sp. PMI_703]|nr:TLC domain-containing protein [Xylogone sp. PMI_703]
MDNLIAQLYPETYAYIQSACDRIHLPLLPPYLLQFLLTFLAYQLFYIHIGPGISARFFPKSYAHFKGKEKLDWDIDVVSFTQALLNFYLALQVVLFDDERKRMNWQERVWGYTEPTAKVLAIANGYFTWHLIMMVRYWKIYGWSMVAHGVATSSLMICGFRPAFMTYAPASYLYEFSNIFLNIHRCMLKLRMEGTRMQVMNGVALFISFFLSRIIWGTYLTGWFCRDIWTAFTATNDQIPVGEERMPLWLLAMYAFSGTLLQALNFMWFYMIARSVYRKLLRGKTS